jgi:hypothetical protein
MARLRDNLLAAGVLVASLGEHHESCVKSSGRVCDRLEHGGKRRLSRHKLRDVTQFCLLLGKPSQTVANLCIGNRCPGQLREPG